MTTMSARATEKSSAYWLFVDGWTVVVRNLLRFKHSPGELIATIIFPVFMIVIFGFIFGSAIPIPGGGNYREFLIPGLFAMGAAASFAGIMQKVAKDNQLGVMDRFRSMPTSRSGVPFGSTGAELISGTLGVVAMAICGFVSGWRVHNGFGEMMAAFALVLLFSYAMSWLGVFLGSLFRNETTAERLAPLFMPITMLSNTFVPTGGMPTWLRTIADWNPVSALVQSCRQLFGNPGVSPPTVWPMAHPVLYIVGWCVALIAVFGPLAVRRFQTMNL
jgi:ABC-2 type transport system permease protein